LHDALFLLLSLSNSNAAVQTFEDYITQAVALVTGLLSICFLMTSITIIRVLRHILFAMIFSFLLQVSINEQQWFNCGDETEKQMLAQIHPTIHLLTLMT